MVKKLFGHEFSSYFRILVPMHLILVVLAFFGRLIQIAESESIFYELGFWGAVAVYALAVMALFMITQIFSVVRFYKNLFAGEGYLTLTLPVSMTQHIWTKLSVSVLAQALNFVIFALSFMLLTAGETFADFVYNLGEALSVIYSEAGFNLIVYIIEFFVILLIYVASTNLIYYTCISLGQTFRKNRIFAAVGMYFAYCVIARFISTVVNMLVLSDAGIALLEKMGTFMEAYPNAFFHSVLAGSIVISVLISAILFLIIRHVMTRKLNLE